MNEQPSSRRQARTAGDQFLAGGHVPIVENVREQNDVGSGRHEVEKHVAGDQFQPVGDAERLGHLAGDFENLGAVPHDRG